jgi:hypothetical protein
VTTAKRVIDQVNVFGGSGHTRPALRRVDVEEDNDENAAV